MQHTLARKSLRSPIRNHIAKAVTPKCLGGPLDDRDRLNDHPGFKAVTPKCLGGPLDDRDRLNDHPGFKAVTPKCLGGPLDDRDRLNDHPGFKSSPGVSNTRPSGCMWPTSTWNMTLCVCATFISPPPSFLFGVPKKQEAVRDVF
ncbi:hypothetical protein TNCV_3791801 [Trichonephila clavipes]|nr:hypothetical protein TNCV_3791801 [Trichonephila clavipes]